MPSHRPTNQIPSFRHEAGFIAKLPSRLPIEFEPSRNGVLPVGIEARKKVHLSDAEYQRSSA